MTLPHQKFREIVFQLLYSFNLGNAEKQAMLELMMAQLKVAKKHVHAAQEKVEKIFLFQNQIMSKFYIKNKRIYFFLKFHIKPFHAFYVCNAKFYFFFDHFINSVRKF